MKRRYIVAGFGGTVYVCDRVYLYKVVGSFRNGGGWGYSSSRARLLAEACCAALNAEHEAWLAAA